MAFVVLTEEQLQDLKKEIILEVRDIMTETFSNFRKPHFDWVSEEEARVMLGVSKSTIQNYRKKGSLNFSQERGKIYIHKGDINQFLLDRYSSRDLPVYLTNFSTSIKNNK
jgi:hypothetical protein